MGVVVGTVFGTRILGKIDEATFRRSVGIALVALGVWTIVSPS